MSADLITSEQIVAEMIRLSRRLDEDHDKLIEAARRYAVAEDRYRLEKAAAYLASSGTVDARKAHVDQATSQSRRESHEAEGLKVAALERVRSTRAQLSALQSVANAVKVEAELAGRYDRTG